MRQTTDLEQRLTAAIQREIDRDRENARIAKHRGDGRQAKRWLDKAEKLERDMAAAYKQSQS